MPELLYEKIMQKMLDKKEMSDKEFVKQLSYIRFSEHDSKRIIEDMKRKGLLKVDGCKSARQITIITPIKLREPNIFTLMRKKRARV